VLALVREGLSNSEIAFRLGVTVNTVRFHVSNLLAKSGAPDRVSLRSWNPQPDEAPWWRLPAFGLPFLKPFGIAAGGACAVAAAGIVVIIAASGRSEEPVPVPQAEQTVVAYPAAVVGTLTRQGGGLVVTEPGGSSFKLTSEMTFARLIGSQVFILGEVEGDSLKPLSGSPVGPYSRCAGVLTQSGGRLSVGGSCGGVELSGVSVERLLALRSEKVTVTILPCTQSHGGRLQAPPIDAFGEERPHICITPPAAGGPYDEQ